MAQMNRETRSDRRIAKKKYTRRFLSVVAVSSVVMSGFAYSQNSSAENGIGNKEIAVELSTKKIDKDTVKIQLDNFTPLVKSIQLNVAIKGNAKFKEDTIKWLATSDSENVKTHVKMGDGNRSMQIFIVSDEPLNNVGANLEICEIDVEKDLLAKSSAYTIDSDIINDEAYSYVLNDTNKQVSGIDMANVSEEQLTINSAPVISLKPSTSIVDGNIVISKGDKFDANSYIVVNDEEDGEISVDKVSVDKVIKTNQVGSYTITYTVKDSEGETGTLVQTVIVEDVKEENVSKPVITIDETVVDGNKLTFTEGDYVNLLDYITAVDYLDRPIEVKIVGDYDLNKVGEYTVTAVAEDRYGNKTEKEITIVVKEKVNDGEENPGDGEGQQPGGGEETPDNGEEQPDGGEETPDNGEGQQPGGGEETPDNGEEQPDGGEETPGDIEIVIPEDIVNNGGDATKELPLLLETAKVTAVEEFISEAKNDFKLTVLDKKVLSNNNVEYFIRLEEKSFFARLFSKEKVYYVTMTVPNTNEFNDVFGELEIEDTAAPTLKYDGELNITVENGSEFKMPVVTANDNFDDNVSVKIVIKDEAGNVLDKIDTTKAGKYTITYTATDNSGNTSEELAIVVEVKDASQGGGSQNPGDGEQSPGVGGEQTPVKPENPEVSVKPENPGVSDESTNIDTNTDEKENNENKIPQTGKGIFYGVTVALAAGLVGIGAFLLKKKK